MMRICENAAVDALEAAYINFDDKRGKSPIGYMSTIVHNNVVNELKNEQKSLGESVDTLGDQEENYSFGIYIANLKQCVRESISELSLIDQIVLKYYINNPKTYIVDVKEDLGLSENAISVRKNRAVKQLVSIMKSKAYYDYINAHYQGVGTSYGFLQFKPAVRCTETYVNESIRNSIWKRLHRSSVCYLNSIFIQINNFGGNESSSLDYITFKIFVSWRLMI